MKSQVKVATIVANSTEGAWSQTYHAGGVTAVVSVRKKEEKETPALSLVGKDLLNTFESEYFTLETKNLASIKQAVDVTYEKSKDTHAISLIVSAVIQNAVYVVLAGEGKILLMRNGSMVTLLEQHEKEAVLSASGFLEGGDVVILQTRTFSNLVSTPKLRETLSSNSVNDTAEILSPNVQKEKDGSAAALLFSYEEEKQPEDTVLSELPAEKEEEKQSEDAASQESIVVTAPTIQRRKTPLTHRQRLFLTIAVIVAIVFAATIYLSVQKKQSTQTATLFSSVFPPAEKKFEEGQGLKDLNASLAHDDFVQAQQMLESAKGKFPANSSEEKQIQTLLDKITAALSTPTQPTTQVTKADASTSPFLGFAAKHSDTPFIAQDDTAFYFADATGITKVAKGTPAKQIIKNGGDWKSLGGFQTYLGNMYVLDTADGIDKYAATSSGFGEKVAYFSGTTPDLSKAVSMAIDGSVWILESTGTIRKYTKGTQDSFTVSGLSQPLSSPSHIVTTVDDTNIYVLDSGNGRLVVIKKDGTFVNQYVNTQLKTATALDVNESAKKAYFLSSGSIYELDLK